MRCCNERDGMKKFVNIRCLKFIGTLSNRLNCFMLPAVAMVIMLPSCAVSGKRNAVVINPNTGRGYYGSPPVDTEVPYYLFHNRYYFGGVWEEGDFIFNGDMNSGRYHYGNSRFYGGIYYPGYRANLTQAQYDEINRNDKNQKS